MVANGSVSAKVADGPLQSQVLLSAEDLARVRQLRKKDPVKAKKLEKRLKEKRTKKGRSRREPGSRVRVAPDISGGLLSAAEESDGVVPGSETAEGEDEEETYIVPSIDEELEELGEVDSSVSEEVKGVFERFRIVEETRAAGKGGGMEDVGFDVDGGYGENELVDGTENGGNDENGEEQNRLQRHEGGADEGDDEDEEELEDGSRRVKRQGLSKKKLKQLRRPTVSQLKQVCSRPEVVEAWDTTAPDPPTLVYLKALRNTVPVPPHWSHKRRYLQGKRGLEKSLFTLPHYIEATRISEIRSAIEEKDAKKTLKQRMREKARPRHRKMNIDYQTLHDAFFKYATKPNLTRFGDVYFEGKETEILFRRYTPGKLTPRCREALGMTSPLDAPPWLLNMQRYGPPPSYPNLVVPGVNAHVPEGAALGFQPGGWGKPPGLEQLKIWGVTPRFEEIVIGDDGLMMSGLGGSDTEGRRGGAGSVGEVQLWGVLQTVDSEEEEEEDAEDTEETEASEEKAAASVGLQRRTAATGADLHAGIQTPTLSVAGQMTPVVLDPSGLASVTSAAAGGFATPGFQRGFGGGADSVSSGLQTPESVDLRRSGFASGGTPKLYTVLESGKAPAQPGALFASDTIYTLPNAGRSQGFGNHPNSASGTAGSGFGTGGNAQRLGGMATPIGPS